MLIELRDIKWLIEFNEDNFTVLELFGCNIALRQDIPEGMFVNPDQIQDLLRVGKVGRISSLLIFSSAVFKSFFLGFSYCGWKS